MKLRVSKRRALESNDAYHSVVLAANGVGAARGGRKTENVDGTTVKPDESIYALEYNTEQTTEKGGGGRVRCLENPPKL